MNKDIYIVFDIETRPLPLETIRGMGLIPPCKTGNIKDPDKIKAKLESHEQESMEDAALDATRSTVCAVGCYVGDNGVDESAFNTDKGLDERVLIERLFESVGDVVNDQGIIIGFNIKGFDLPYLYRRAWILGIKPPAYLRNGRYWTHHVVDLMEEWSLGNTQDRIGLDRAMKALGVGKKNGDGKDFYKLLDTDPNAAIDYLRNDVLGTRDLARKMGVIA